MRGTFVLRHGRLVEKSKVQPSSGTTIMPDISPFTCQDGTPITSRSHLRDYEQEHGVKQIGNDLASFHKELRAKVYGET